MVRVSIFLCLPAQMRRIDEAIAYFRKWPSLKSQKEAIRGLEELANTAAKECIDEFNRLMRTIGPAVQFQVWKGFAYCLAS